MEARVRRRAAADARRDHDSEAPRASRPRVVPAAGGGAAPLRLKDGTSAVIHERGLEIRDPAGRLLVRYADGAATIAVPEGDLTLCAPNGRVAIRSGQD